LPLCSSSSGDWPDRYARPLRYNTTITIKIQTLRLNVFVVSNGSRPIRPPGMSNVSMILVGDSADAADDWIAERVGATDVCVTSDIPLASRCLKKGGERGSPCLSARADPRRGTDRDELDGYARWATWLGGFLRRSGLYCPILSILIDQPARGRSAWQPDIDGKLTAPPPPRPQDSSHVLSRVSS
jgi:hypothetical protein